MQGDGCILMVVERRVQKMVDRSSVLCGAAEDVKFVYRKPGLGPGLG